MKVPDQLLDLNKDFRFMTIDTIESQRDLFEQRRSNVLD